MLVHGLIGLTSILLASVLSYIYHFISVRLLSTETYGSLSVIIGLFTIFTVPTQSIQRIIARDVAKLAHNKKEDEIRYLLRSTIKMVSVWSIVVGVLFFASSHLLSSIYNEERLVKPIHVLSIIAPLWYLSSVLKGYIQGREKIILLGASVVLEQVIKVALGVSLMFLGYGLFGAAAAIGSGVLVVLPLLLFFSLKDFRGRINKHETSFGGSFTRIFLTEVLLMAFVFLDLFYVKKFLGSAQAGFYNVAALTSKVLMYSMFGIMFAFLPKASKLSLKDDWGKIRVLMIKSAVILTPLFLVVAIFTEPIVAVSYTKAYLPSVPALRILLIGMFVYALFNIPLNLMWSQHEENFPLKLSFGVLVLDGFLLYFLVPKHGLVGAASATTISSLILLITSYTKVKRMRNFNALPQ